jgi:hypothetical protein
MREIPSEMEFHGLLCQKGDANSDRNAHDTGRDGEIEIFSFVSAS